MNTTLKKSLTIVVFLFVIIGLAVGTNELIKPIVADNIMKEKISEYSKVLDGIVEIKEFDEVISEDVIIDQQVALNDKGEVIGYLYKAQDTNQWGMITVVAAIDDTGKILGIDSVVDQSMKKDETRSFISKYKNSSIKSPETVDGSTGPTTKDSVDLADRLIASIAKAHEVVKVADPYLEFFTNGYDEIVKDNTFNPTKTILEKKLVKKAGSVVGYIFKSKASGVYHDSESDSIEMEFILDENQLYLGNIEIEYNHTGSFKRHVKTYLAKLINTDIKAYELNDEDVDGKTGATNSVKVVGEMLEDIRDSFGSLNLSYNEFFTNGYDEVIKDDTFAATTITLDKQIIKKEGNIVGYVYLAKNSGVYIGTKNDSVEFEFILDENHIFKGFIEVEYNHTGGSFKDSTLAYLESFKETDIKVYELKNEDVDGQTGATNTAKIIGAMLEDIKGVIASE